LGTGQSIVTIIPGRTLRPLGSWRSRWTIIVAAIIVAVGIIIVAVRIIVGMTVAIICVTIIFVAVTIICVAVAISLFATTLSLVLLFDLLNNVGLFDHFTRICFTSRRIYIGDDITVVAEGMINI
jgi:hypothetical protein